MRPGGAFVDLGARGFFGFVAFSADARAVNEVWKVRWAGDAIVCSRAITLGSAGGVAIYTSRPFLKEGVHWASGQTGAMVQDWKVISAAGALSI